MHTALHIRTVYVPGKHRQYRICECRYFGFMGKKGVQFSGQTDHKEGNDKCLRTMIKINKLPYVQNSVFFNLFDDDDDDDDDVTTMVMVLGGGVGRMIHAHCGHSRTYSQPI